MAERLSMVEQQLSAAQSKAAKADNHSFVERENIKTYVKKKQSQLNRMEAVLEAYRQHMVANCLAVPEVPISELGSAQVGLHPSCICLCCTERQLVLLWWMS